MAVPYDATFKSNDGFQRPRTRGLRTATGDFDDRRVRYKVGVRATVVYLSEQSPAPWVTQSGSDRLDRTTYTYDLEIHQELNRPMAKGGEWHQNAHPDFLWIPKREALARSSFDYLEVLVAADQEPASELKSLAQHASSAD